MSPNTCLQFLYCQSSLFDVFIDAKHYSASVLIAFTFRVFIIEMFVFFIHILLAKSCLNYRLITGNVRSNNKESKWHFLRQFFSKNRLRNDNFFNIFKRKKTHSKIVLKKIDVEIEILKWFKNHRENC